ncbi:MAG TPA: hypothetical protein VFS77_19860 [Pyrinomonadaceae bacterium]|nr:hypothetical protein [Pyrinomonadaceae bacterium]
MKEADSIRTVNHERSLGMKVKSNVKAGEGSGIDPNGGTKP